MTHERKRSRLTPRCSTVYQEEGEDWVTTMRQVLESILPEDSGQGQGSAFAFDLFIAYREAYFLDVFLKLTSSRCQISRKCQLTYERPDVLSSVVRSTPQSNYADSFIHYYE